MSFVYLAENRERSILKIGVSRDPLKRLRALRYAATSCLGRDPGSFRLMLTMPGSRAKEQELLGRFRDLRLGNRREWISHSRLVFAHFRKLGAVDAISEYFPLTFMQRIAGGRPPVITKCPYCKGKVNGSAEFRAHLPRCPKRKAA